MSITENIQTRLDDNEFAAGTFVDLKKQFDMVDHEILIQKLEHCGVRRFQRTGSVLIWSIENSFYELTTMTL